MKTLNKIYKQKFIAIIRGYTPDDALAIARSLYEGGVKVFEIATNSPKPLKTIERITDEFGDKVTVGAGTVLDPETARSAILAGSQFILSPTLNIETIKMTKRYGAISIPGAYTPTEILTAFEEGGDIVKIFPASKLGPDYVKELLGPLNQLKLLPTGGINLDNMNDYLEQGAIGVGIGSSLVHQTDQVSTEFLTEIKTKAEKFVQSVQ